MRHARELEFGAGACVSFSTLCLSRAAPVLDVALDLTRSKSELVIENALLRQQLAVLNRQVKRPKLTWRDRSIIVFLSSKLRGWKDAVSIVQPDTVLRWHRDFFRFVRKRKTKAQSKPGRAPLSDDDIARVRRMARENATWGAERIRRELMHLGIEVSILNERHLHRIAKEYETYFNNARPHQGIEQRIPCQPGPPESPPVNGKPLSRPVLNGLHHTTSWVATQSVGHSQAQRPIYH
ncbi:MAG: hypothetical protein PVI59_07010 [Anaerolineae bacterium]